MSSRTGNFSFDGAPSGLYQVLATASGLAVVIALTGFVLASTLLDAPAFGPSMTGADESQAGESVPMLRRPSERSIEFYLVGTPDQQGFVDWLRGMNGAAGNPEVHALQVKDDHDLQSAATAVLSHLLRQEAPAAVRVVDLRDYR